MITQKYEQAQIGHSPSDQLATASLLHRAVSVLTIFSIILISMPLMTQAKWETLTTDLQSQEMQESSINNDFPISLVPNGRQRNPAIACSPDDRCLSVWENLEDESWRIYGQWVVSGELNGGNFPISTVSSDQRDPEVVYNGSQDEYLVVWWDDRDRIMTGYNIYGRLIASKGDTGTNDCPIVTAASDQQYPDATYNSTTNEYLVVWQDYRHGDWDIYGRKISDDCTQLDSDFPVSRTPGRQWHPTVAYNGIANQYLMVWWDSRNSQTSGEDIYGQIVSPSGALLKDNFPVSTADGFQGYPDVACSTANNEYLATWADNRNSASTGFDIYGQRVSSQGELLDSQGSPGADPAVNFAVSKAAGEQEQPVLVYDSTMNQYLAAWQDMRHGDLDVFAQLVSGQGELLDQIGNPGADPAVNFAVSAAPGNQEYPALTYGKDGYSAVWQDSRHYDFVAEDIYGQQLSSQGEPLGSSFPLVTAPVFQTYPAAAYDGLQSYLVAWQDDRNAANTDYDIYGQIVDIRGTLPNINFPISAAASDQYFPAVASNNQGEFLAVWQDSRHGSWDIYGQSISNKGALSEGDFEISAAASDQCFPALAYGNDSDQDRYLIVWQDHRNGNWDIYGRCVVPDGSQGDSFPITLAEDNQERPDVIYNSIDNEFLVIWQDYRDANWDIYGRRISGQCSPIGEEFAIAQETSRQWYPALAYSSSASQYLAVWWDDRSAAAAGGDIYGQRLSPEGEPLGDNFSISDAQSLQWYPDVAYSSFDNDYLVVWGDNRNSVGTAFDIYGQRVASDGEMNGDNFPISVAPDNQRYPALSHNTLEDQCLVVWQDDRNYHALLWEIYGALLGDVAVTQEAPTKAPPGSNIIYTISYNNQSNTNDPRVTITDILPPDTTYVSDTAPFSRTLVGNTVTWEIGALAGGESGQFTLVAAIPPTTPSGTILTNTIQINTSLPESDYSNNSAETTTKIPTWTFMVYLNGDNDLDPFMEEAFNSMEKAAQNPDVNVLTLWDRCSLLSSDGQQCFDKDEGIENTRLYAVEYDNSDLIASPVQEVDWNPGELDMGNPNTLVNFVTWARDHYPAKHYFLSILDHGGGWSPTFPDTSGQRVASLSRQDDSFIPLRRSYHVRGGTGLSWDFSDGYNYLSSEEMRLAFSGMTKEGSERIDIVFYDACLMGMLEEVYEIKDFADYFVGSENEAWGSTPYEQYINSITDSTQPRELAVEIVNEYTASLPLTGHPSTISALDLAAIEEVSVAVDDLARALINGLVSAETILQTEDAYLLTQKFDYDSDFRLENQTDGYIDLYDFALKIQENVTDGAILAAAQSVIDALEPEGSTVVAQQYRNGYPWVTAESLEYWNLANAHGISIYLPLGQDLQMTLENEEGLIQTVKVRDWYTNDQLSFAADTQWDEFIAAYYAATSTPIPTSALQGPRGGIRPIRWRIYLPLAVKTH